MAQILISIVTFAVLTFLHCAADQNVFVVTPNARELFMKEGVPQHLHCRAEVNDDKYTLAWETNDAIPQDRKDVKISSKIFNEDGKTKYEASAEIIKFVPDHSVDYTCKLTNVQTNVVDSSYTIKLIPVKETKTEPKWFYGNTSATVSCGIEVEGTDNDGNSFTVGESPIWFKNETAVKDLKDKDRFNIYENNTMTISEPQRTDAGLYTLRFMIQDTPYDCEAAIFAGPFVKDFEKSKNLIQEEDMELRCDVLGYPYAVVTWSKDNVPVNNSKSNPRVKLSAFNNYVNARLTISKVDFDDAGNYRCTASVLNETSSKDIVVRVKDKMAALWPFLGIVAEVIVLCVIIFIYENRRNKQAQQANHNAHEAGGATNDTAEGLRHRNTPANNPRA